MRGSHQGHPPPQAVCLTQGYDAPSTPPPPTMQGPQYPHYTLSKRAHSP